MEIDELQIVLEELENELVQLDEELSKNGEEIKEIKTKIETPYSIAFNLIAVLFLSAVMACVVFFLSKWWINTEFSVWVGILLFLVAIFFLAWDIACIATSTRRYHEAEIDKYKEKLETLLKEKSEAIDKKYTVLNEIKVTKEDIENIRVRQIKEAEEEERRKEARKEELYQAAHVGNTVNRQKLKEAVEAGHIKAKIEMAKFLIDDYFSDMYTSDEKKQIIKEMQTNLEGINTDKDTELELLSLFSYTMYRCTAGGSTMKENLKKIREIKENSTLSEKYDSLATKMIRHIVSVIEEADRSWEERQRARECENSSINYSRVCKHYISANGVCAFNSNSACTIHCFYDKYNQVICSDYNRG